MTDVSARRLASFGQQVSWIAAARTAAVLVTYAIPLVLVRQFDQHQFGLYKQAFLLVSTAITLLPLGFATSAFYFLPRSEGRGGEVVLNILLFQAVMGTSAGVVLWAWPDLVAGIFQGDDLVPYARYIAVVVFLGVLSRFWESVIIANDDVARAAVLFGVTQVSKAILLTATAVLFGTLEALLVAAACQGLLELSALLVYVWRHFGSSPWRFNPRLMWRQLEYAVPLGVAGLLFWLQSEGHHYIVGRMFSPGDYAIYAVGCFGVPLVAILNDSVGSVLLPQVNRLHAEKRDREILGLTAKALRRLWAVYIPLYAFFLAAGKDFIALLFTERYLESWPIFAINLTLMPIAGLAVVNDALIRTYPAYRFLLIRVRLIAAPLLLTAVWMAATRYGAIGAVAVAVGAVIGERVLVAWCLGRDLGVRGNDLAPLASLRMLTLAAASAGVATALVRQALPPGDHAVAFLGCAVVFAAVYVCLGHVWHVFTAGERRLIDAMVGRLAFVRGK
jgi:O-antigen/teichoic acid export membrane protein